MTLLKTEEPLHVVASLNDSTGAMKPYVNGALSSQMTTTVKVFRDTDPVSNPSMGIDDPGGHLEMPCNIPLRSLIDELGAYNRVFIVRAIHGICQARCDGIIRCGNDLAAESCPTGS